MNLNKAYILGNVTRNPEVRSMPSGQQVANFGIATNRFYTDSSGQKKQEAEFHNIVCFGRLADISARYLTKGSLVLVEGRIKTRNWQNADGIKHYRTEIIAENIQLGPRTTGGDQNKFSEIQANSNQSDSKFFDQSQEKDIPVIEENQTSSLGNSDSLNENNEEIDVKNIPF